MAITFTANRAAPSGSFAASGIFGFNVGTNCTVGSTLIMTVALDDTSTVANGNQFVSVTDGAGNSWLPIRNNGSGAGSNTGCAVAMFYCKPSRQITTTTGVFVFGAFAGTGTRVAVIIDEFAGVSSLIPYAFNGVVPTVGAIGTSATPSASITPAASGQLVYGGMAIETNTAVTGDADVVNGSWAAIQSVVSNSGADLTSMTVSRQYKIVTAGGAQTWNPTLGASKIWAENLVVFAVAAAHVAATFPEGNPHYPNFAGFEGLPTASSQLPVDAGTGYVYNYVTLPDEVGSSYQVVGAEYVTPQDLTQHHIAYDWYYQLNLKDASQDDVQTIYLPLRRATSQVGGSPSGTAVTSGALNTDAAFLAALTAVSGAYVKFPDVGAFLDLYFDTTQLTANFLNSRIVNFGIQYVAFRDNSANAAAVSQGFALSYTDTLSNAGGGTGGTIGYWLTAYYQKDQKYETRWFGETNLFPRTADRISSAAGSKQNMNAPWRVADLLHMNNGDESLKFTITGQPSATDFSQTQFDLDYIVMVVQLAPERRMGGGIRTVNNTYTGSGLYPFAFDFTRFQDAIDTSKLALAAAPTNTVGAGYTVLVREAAPASESDYLRLQTGASAITSLFEAIGPSAQLKAFTQPRESLYSQPDTQFVPIVNGAPYGALQQFSDYTSSILVFDENSLSSDGPSFGGYNGLSRNGLIQVYNGKTQTATIQAPGGVQYTYLKVLIKPDPALTGFGGSTSIVFTVEQPLATVLGTVTITPAAWASVVNTPAIGDGWKEVVAQISVPVTPSAGSVFIKATSGGAVPANIPWYWAAATPDNIRWDLITATNPEVSDPLNGYGGVTPDYAAVLEIALPVPTITMSTVTGTTMPRASAMCISATEKLAKFTFTNGAQYDKLVIFRYDTMGEPIYVGTVFSPQNNVTFVDLATPWDIPQNTLKYQVYGVRNADNLWMVTTATWNDISVNPGAALALAYNPDVGAIGQSLTNYAGFDLIYAPTAESGAVQMDWKTSNGATLIPLHGIDKYIQLRESEQRGLSVTFTVLVDKFGVVACDTTLPTTYDSLEVAAPNEQPSQGGAAMSPIVFGGDQSPLGYHDVGLGPSPRGMSIGLRDLERLGAPITLKLPGGHTRLMNVAINSMMVTPWTGLFMAEIELTDAAPIDFFATNIPITS